MRLLKDESSIDSWKSFFENAYKTEIETIALSFPEKRSLFVDYWNIDKADPKLAELLINQPYKAIFNAEEALKDIDVAALPHGKKMFLHLRVINLPETCIVPIRRINPFHGGKLITVDGIIKRRMPVKAKLQVAVFQCQKCGATIKVDQGEDILREPLECYENQGGCGRMSSFKLLTNLSTFIPFQKIELQEEPETVRGAVQPQKITICFEDDITSVDHLNPGDRISVIGIVHIVQKRKGTLKLSIFDFILNACSYQMKETAYEDIELTDGDIEEIKKASKDPLIFDRLQASIAPSLYGLDVEKDGIVVLLFGGKSKILADGTRVRGDLHILLIGDPGTAKSQLLNYVSKLSPRSIFTEGPSSTGAGLTATAVRDEFSDNQWMLEAGALVLADQGIACIDEFDKMDENDRNKIHRAMEQQEISVAKAGINATLRCRCSILAAANPKSGRFDNFIPTPEQIDLPVTLFTRFDLIFSIIDKPNETRDMEMAHHILTAGKTESDKTCFPPEFVRKYVAYAKSKIHPEMNSEEVLDILKNYYVTLRKKQSDGPIPISPRQLETLNRLATANARIRLSNEVSVEDAERAVKIFNNYIQRLCVDSETGLMNWDIMATGISYSQQNRMRTVIDIISNLGKSSDEGASPEDIISECEIRGISKEKAEDAIKHLERNNKQIFKTPKGGYKTNV